jgi:protein-disulfide isomerase
MMTARVAVIIYSDFQCPACRSLALNTLPEIEREYVHKGTALLVFSDFPLESIHPDALHRAAIAECAARQGRFWEVHDRLFRLQDRVDLIKKEFRASAPPGCTQSDVTETIRLRASRARQLGVNGTPTVFVGRMFGDTVQVDEILAAVPTVRELARAINRSLRKKS